MERCSFTLVAACVFAVSATFSSATSAQAADEDPRFDAMALISLGEHKRACEVLDGAYPENTRDADAQFLRGRCRAGQGDYAAARSAFERVVEIDPDADQARVFIAQTYAAEGNRAEAREAYREILEASPPTGVRRSVEQALASLRSAKRWFASAALAAVYDSNFNSGPADAEITAFGLPFTLDAANLEQDSFGYEATFSGGYAWPLRGGRRLLLQGGAQHTDYEEGGTAFDSQVFWGALALSGALGDLRYTVAPRLSQTLLDYDAFRFSAGGDLSVEYDLSEKLTLIASGGARALDYAFQEDRDGYSAYVSQGAVVSTPLGEITANYGKAWVGADLGFRSFTTDGARVQLAAATGGLTVAPFYQYRQSNYDALEPGFSVARVDDTHEVGLFALQSLSGVGLTRLALQLRYSYANNDSNVALYDFDRHRVSLGVVHRW